MGDIVIINGDTDFSLGYLGPTLVSLKLDIGKSLKFMQVPTDKGQRPIKILNLLQNENVEE